MNHNNLLLEIDNFLESSGIPYTILMSKVCEVLEEVGHLKYFGHCYMKILQNFILKPQNNLTMVELDAWKCMTKMFCFAQS